MEYKMAEFSLVVEAQSGLKNSVICFFFFGEGVGKVKSTISSISSTADSSESLNCPPESLFQTFWVGMESLLAICWEFDRQEEWVTWAQLEGLLGCPYQRDVEADILWTTN